MKYLKIKDEVNLESLTKYGFVQDHCWMSYEADDAKRYYILVDTEEDSQLYRLVTVTTKCSWAIWSLPAVIFKMMTDGIIEEAEMKELNIKKYLKKLGLRNKVEVKGDKNEY